MADMGTNEASKFWGYAPEAIRKYCQSRIIDGVTHGKKSYPGHIPKEAKCHKKAKNK